jgi:hypothetical protein
VFFSPSLPCCKLPTYFVASLLSTPFYFPDLHTLSVLNMPPIRNNTKRSIVTVKTREDARGYLNEAHTTVGRAHARMREIKELVQSLNSEYAQLLAIDKVSRDHYQRLDIALGLNMKANTNEPILFEKPSIAAELDTSPDELPQPTNRVDKTSATTPRPPKSSDISFESSSSGPSFPSSSTGVCFSSNGNQPNKFSHNSGNHQIRNEHDNNYRIQYEHDNNHYGNYARHEYIFDWGAKEGQSVSEVGLQYMKTLRGQPWIWADHHGLEEAIERYFTMGTYGTGAGDQYQRLGTYGSRPKSMQYGAAGRFAPYPGGNNAVEYSSPLANRMHISLQLGPSSQVRIAAQPGPSSQVLCINCPDAHPTGAPKVHFSAAMREPSVRYWPKPVEIKKEPGLEEPSTKVVLRKYATRKGKATKVRL